jgi:hypothetical protein
MTRSVLVAGLLGGLVIFVWLFVSQAILPIRSGYVLNTVPDQMEVHRVLKEKIAEPGIYVVPYLSPEEEAATPGYRDEPIFQIAYHGETHGSVAGPLQPALLAMLLGPWLAAWLLSMTSPAILASYARRVLFVALLGVFLVVVGVWLPTLYDARPAGLTVFYVVNGILTWILAGLVIAWRVGAPARD